jgi:hypothetical protein
MTWIYVQYIHFLYADDTVSKTATIVPEASTADNNGDSLLWSDRSLGVSRLCHTTLMSCCNDQSCCVRTIPIITRASPANRSDGSEATLADEMITQTLHLDPCSDVVLSLCLQIGLHSSGISESDSVAAYILCKTWTWERIRVYLNTSTW